MATKPKTAAEILASTIPAPVGVHASLWNRYVCFLKKIVFCIVFNTRLYYIFQYNITWKYIFKFISTSNKKNFTLWANWWSSWYLKSRTFVIYWSYGNESMCHEQVTWPDYSCLHMSVHITNQHAFGAFFFFFLNSWYFHATSTYTTKTHGLGEPNCYKFYFFIHMTVTYFHFSLFFVCIAFT